MSCIFITCLLKIFPPRSSHSTEFPSIQLNQLLGPQKPAQLQLILSSARYLIILDLSQSGPIGFTIVKSWLLPLPPLYILILRSDTQSSPGKGHGLKVRGLWGRKGFNESTKGRGVAQNIRQSQKARQRQTSWDRLFYFTHVETELNSRKWLAQTQASEWQCLDSRLNVPSLFASLVCVSSFIAEPADAPYNSPFSLWLSSLYQCMTCERTTRRDGRCDGLNHVLQKDAEVLTPSTCFLQQLVYTCILLCLLVLVRSVCNNTA